VFNRLLAARNLLVLSFGIALDFAFDDHMASLGFTVHGSDPTLTQRGHRMPLVVPVGHWVPLMASDGH
jgi:hypothetical protein